MASVEYHSVQPFVRTTKGRIAAGPIRSCTSPEHAKRLAERLVAERSAVGALAYTRAGDDEFNVFDEPVFLVRVGNVPEHDSF